ncbi:hypothetical protein HDU97_003673 [Phlyctochytrium planicorne]|nr:hypothetical protein HDU97_003673 [Phlyctochytrium planicorne]
MKFSSLIFAGLAVLAVSVQAAPVDVAGNVAVVAREAMPAAVPEPVPAPEDGTKLVNLDRRKWKDRFKKFMKKAMKVAMKVAAASNPAIGAAVGATGIAEKR